MTRRGAGLASIWGIDDVTRPLAAILFVPVLLAIGAGAAWLILRSHRGSLTGEWCV
jgi:hypothetical protein